MKTETKQTHTPGPWLVDPRESEVIKQYDVTNPDRTHGLQTRGIASVYNPNNCHIIAAAPLLLNACKAALVYMQDVSGTTNCNGPISSQLREAIAAATGGAQ